MEIVDKLLNHSRLALSKAITAVENEYDDAVKIMTEIYPHTGNAYVIGITGPPGAGKSTLTDKLAKEYRKRGKTVGIVAIDPTSPYSGGAILGDRIRMMATGAEFTVVETGVIFFSSAWFTMAFAIGCVLFRSTEAASRISSSLDMPGCVLQSCTLKVPLVNVPVLSKTIVSASATASKNLPPFTVILFSPASRIAESTVIGIASFNAQEKSTIRIDNAFVVFLVSSQVSAVPPREYGTSLSARCSALLSNPDFNFSESSIIAAIFS